MYDRITGAENGKLADFKDGSSGSGNDYTYDVNGSMITDNNKTISATVYNYLKLPSLITTTKGTIAYDYSVSGQKQRKTVVESSTTVNVNGTNYSTSITTTTLYLDNLVFESKVFSNGVADDEYGYDFKLLFAGHEEGRIRFEKASEFNCPVTTDRLVYDYFLKDHLGNVRSVLTEQSEEICYIPASLEEATYTREDDIFNINNDRRIPTSTAGATGGNFQDRVYQTHGGIANQKTGLGMVLKVMSGDKVRISAESFYTLPGGGVGNPWDVAVTELLSAFVGSPDFVKAKGVLTTTDVANIGTNNSILDNLNSGNPGNMIAKAYVNWILFDEQLKYVSSGSDPVQDNGLGGYKPHTAWVTDPVLTTKNGFMYVYACPPERSEGG